MRYPIGLKFHIQEVTLMVLMAIKRLDGIALCGYHQMKKTKENHSTHFTLASDLSSLRRTPYLFYDHTVSFPRTTNSLNSPVVLFI